MTSSRSLEVPPLLSGNGDTQVAEKGIIKEKSISEDISLMKTMRTAFGPSDGSVFWLNTKKCFIERRLLLALWKHCMTYT